MRIFKFTATFSPSLPTETKGGRFSRNSLKTRKIAVAGSFPERAAGGIGIQFRFLNTNAATPCPKLDDSQYMNALPACF
jgi:hypothetical protein